MSSLSLARREGCFGGVDGLVDGHRLMVGTGKPKALANQVSAPNVGVALIVCYCCDCAGI